MERYAERLPTMRPITGSSRAKGVDSDGRGNDCEQTTSYWLARLVGVATDGAVNVGQFSEGQRRFLEYHRNSVLLMAAH